MHVSHSGGVLFVGALRRQWATARNRSHQGFSNGKFGGVPGVLQSHNRRTLSMFYNKTMFQQISHSLFRNVHDFIDLHGKIGDTKS